MRNLLKELASVKIRNIKLREKESLTNHYGLTYTQKKPEILVQEVLAGKMLKYSQEKWASDAAIN